MVSMIFENMMSGQSCLLWIYITVPLLTSATAWNDLERPKELVSISKSNVIETLLSVKFHTVHDIFYHQGSRDLAVRIYRIGGEHTKLSVKTLFLPNSKEGLFSSRINFLRKFLKSGALNWNENLYERLYTVFGIIWFDNYRNSSNLSQNGDIHILRRKWTDSRWKLKSLYPFSIIKLLYTD